MDISRTAWDSFIRCKRCFFLERKLKIKSIGMPGYPINSRIDALLKEEFDVYRKKQEPHPIFKKKNLNFVPFKMDMEKLNDFRNNRRGVRARKERKGRKGKRNEKMFSHFGSGGPLRSGWAAEAAGAGGAEAAGRTPPPRTTWGTPSE